MQSKKEKMVARLLLQNKIGVLPTDTIYGLVGRALSKKAVQKIYKLRKRNAKKPMIVLIDSLDDLKLFGIKLDGKTRKILQRVWPGKVSVVLPCPLKKFSYLHRGEKTLALRMPKNRILRKLLKQTGPLVAPSANREGEKPAETIKEAYRYFGDKSNFYVDALRLHSPPSTLIKLTNGRIVILRKGVAML